MRKRWQRNGRLEHVPLSMEETLVATEGFVTTDDVVLRQTIEATMPFSVPSTLVRCEEHECIQVLE